MHISTLLTYLSCCSENALFALFAKAVVIWHTVVRIGQLHARKILVTYITCYVKLFRIFWSDGFVSLENGPNRFDKMQRQRITVVLVLSGKSSTLCETGFWFLQSQRHGIWGAAGKHPGPYSVQCLCGWIPKILQKNWKVIR